LASFFFTLLPSFLFIRCAAPAAPEKAVRRKFAAEYKRSILAQADAGRGQGAIGALLRREGLYSSHLSPWRRQRKEGTRQALSVKKRGRKSNFNPLVPENAGCGPRMLGCCAAAATIPRIPLHSIRATISQSPNPNPTPTPK
jgi:hypothetical protein